MHAGTSGTITSTCWTTRNHLELRAHPSGNTFRAHDLTARPGAPISDHRSTWLAQYAWTHDIA
jgi:hypothetical protein